MTNFTKAVDLPDFDIRCILPPTIMMIAHCNNIFMILIENGAVTWETLVLFPGQPMRYVNKTRKRVSMWFATKIIG